MVDNPMFRQPERNTQSEFYLPNHLGVKHIEQKGLRNT